MIHDVRNHDNHWSRELKYYIFLLIACFGLVSCSEEPTPAQLEIVDRLIQEQIDISYEEPNWNITKGFLLKNDETVKETAERNKQLYTEAHDFLIALKNKPYKDKEVWAINMLVLQIEGLERNLKILKNSDKELILLIERWKKWLTILQE